MTSKERVYHAIRREPVDRVPRFVWLGNAVTRQLCNKYQISKSELDLQIENDVLSTWLSINGEMERNVPEGTEFVDEWGITWKRQGYYNMVIEHPMEDLDAEQIAAYPLPDPLEPQRYVEFDRLKKVYGDQYFIGADVSGAIFEPAYHLRGMENLLLDLASESEEAEILLDRMTEFTIGVCLECVKKGADWIWLGDDMGTQQGMMMSPDMWRTHFKPRMIKIIDAIHAAKADQIIAYHSCGSITPIISDLVEIGIDVLNPIQESAANMNQQKIKEEFGDRLTMMCGPDTQQFLITATPEETAQETRRIIKGLGKNGGYIFAVSHTIQPDVPAENIMAMYQVVNEPAAD